MAIRNDYAGIDPYAVARIRAAAGRLIRTAGFSESERDDLEQELMLDLLRRLPKFDPARATLPTFVARVVSHGTATLVGARCAAHRDGWLNAPSLNDDVADEDGACAEVWQTLDHQEQGRRVGVAERDAFERLDLGLDLVEALAALPPDLRVLCARLAGDSITDVARDTGTPRATLYGRIAEIRRRLADAGLDPDRARRRFAGRAGMYQGEASTSRNGRTR
ncbi:MAG: RNA polymerase subunit sigma-24 [Planctomycetes bacterium]|nr:RNA polymerase subunit sigma-24 [Planctomycetota bacterium]